MVTVAIWPGNMVFFCCTQDEKNVVRITISVKVSANLLLIYGFSQTLLNNSVTLFSRFYISIGLFCISIGTEQICFFSV